MSRNAAENELEPDAGLNAGAIFDFDGLEADVIGVFKRWNGAAAVECDIEFAGQTIERALVQDMKVPRTGIGPGIDQFLPADTGSGVAGHVADVVGAGAARGEAQILNSLDDMDRILRRDLPKLQIGARCHMRITAAEFFGKISNPRELPMGKNTVRNTQPAHIAVLRGCDIEETIITPAKIVGGLRKFVTRRLSAQFLIGVKRVLFAFPLFLVRKFLACLDRFVLSQEVGRVGTHGFWLWQPVSKQTAKPKSHCRRAPERQRQSLQDNASVRG